MNRGTVSLIHGWQISIIGDVTMGKKLAVKTILLLVLIGITIAATAPIRYSRNSAGAWMAKLDDSRSIRTVSIPGTHDSGALYSFAGIFGKCQTLKISQQLEIGVRFLDLRLRLVDDELFVYHNFVEQKANFDDVLSELVSFLRQNPTEFLIVSLKEEEAPVRSGKPFSETVEAALCRYPEIVCTDDSLPETVGSARGKMHILARYENSEIGLDCASGWEHNTSFRLNDLYIQDHYKLDRAEEKMPDITAAFAAAASGAYGMVLNYTSCYLTEGFPPSYAGTPAHIINPWLQRQLTEADGPAGVVICDFITSELSMAIIGRNFS